MKCVLTRSQMFFLIRRWVERATDGTRWPGGALIRRSNIETLTCNKTILFHLQNLRNIIANILFRP